MTDRFECWRCGELTREEVRQSKREEIPLYLCQSCGETVDELVEPCAVCGEMEGAGIRVEGCVTGPVCVGCLDEGR